jgi:hypothetical protein
MDWRRVLTAHRTGPTVRVLELDDELGLRLAFALLDARLDGRVLIHSAFRSADALGDRVARADRPGARLPGRVHRAANDAVT